MASALLIYAVLLGSLLSGLRPDTVGTWNFFSTYRYGKYLLLPTQLQRSGYGTYAYGKIRHWDKPEYSGDVWDYNTDFDW